LLILTALEKTDLKPPAVSSLCNSWNLCKLNLEQSRKCSCCCDPSRTTDHIHFWLSGST